MRGSKSEKRHHERTAEIQAGVGLAEKEGAWSRFDGLGDFRDEAAENLTALRSANRQEGGILFRSNTKPLTRVTPRGSVCVRFPQFQRA